MAGEGGHGVRLEDGVVALVEDDGQPGGVGQRLVVAAQPLLVGLDKVGRQGEQPVGPRGLGGGGEP